MPTFDAPIDTLTVTSTARRDTGLRFSLSDSGIILPTQVDEVESLIRHLGKAHRYWFAGHLPGTGGGTLCFQRFAETPSDD